MVNTPTTLAQKYWITNGAVHAKHVVVFAQLHVGGRNEGIHGVLVRIRDDDLKTMPQVKFGIVYLWDFVPSKLTIFLGQVTVEDMGYKMGLNGVDNAKLAFHNVRVPRENLLNKV